MLKVEYNSISLVHAPINYLKCTWKYRWCKQISYLQEALLEIEDDGSNPSYILTLFFDNS